MADAKQAKQGEKAAKIRRKPERESVLSPIFTVSRQTASIDEPSSVEQKDEVLLRQSSSYRTSPEENSPTPEEEIQARPQAGGYDFSKVPIHSQVQATQKDLPPPAFGWGSSYRPARKSGPAWGKGVASRPDFIQRLPTDFGDFKDTTYNTLKNKTGKEIGVEIVLEFKPNQKVNAKLFGLTQALKPTNKGKPNPVDVTAEKRMVKKGVGAGWYIDQLGQKKFRNPMYAVGAVSATDIELGQGVTPEKIRALTPKQIKQVEAGGTKGQTHTGWGEHGYRYKDAGGWKEKVANLHDTPVRPNGGKNAGQVFETAALAMEGAQKGTYYGSVEWGWKTDDAGVFTKLPLKVVSMGVPSDEFMAAAKMWKKSKTAGNESVIPLPIVEVMKIYNSPIDVMLELGKFVGIPKGSKYKVLDTSDPLAAKIEVTDGPYKGQKGYVDSFANRIKRL